MEGQEVDVPICKETDVGWKFWKKRRYIVSLLALLGSASSYIVHVNLSIAIVAMTTSDTEKKPEFDWDSRLQGHLLSAFFYGYASTFFIGGWLSARVGGKRVVGIAIGITALTTLITPFIVRFNVYLYMALRVLEGLCEGLPQPGTYEIWSKWAPPLERSKMATIAISGDSIGTVFTMFTCGYMAEKYSWPTVFYIYGIIIFTVASLWLYFVTDRPEDDPRISALELEYIKQSLGQSDKKQKILHPWKSIFSSPAVFAITAAQFTEYWGFFTMLTQLPKYLNDVHNFNPEKAGFCLALPYILLAIVELTFGQLADYLQSKNMLNTTQVRKLFTCTSFILQMIFTVLAAYVDTPARAVACLTMGVGSGGISTSGYLINHLDIAPQHAGVLMGITSTIAVMSGVLSPVISGYVVQNKTAEEWRIVFIISGCMNLLGAIIYGIFGSGEPQKWAEEPKTGDLEVYSNKAFDISPHE